MSHIDWNKVRQSLPATAADLLDVIEKAHGSGGEDPARAVELAIRERLAALARRFEEIKGGGR